MLRAARKTSAGESGSLMNDSVWKIKFHHIFSRFNVGYMKKSDVRSAIMQRIPDASD